MAIETVEKVCDLLAPGSGIRDTLSDFQEDCFMSSGIQAIFFDLGDTLVRIKFEILQNICETIGRVREQPLETDEYIIAFQEEWSKRRTPLNMHLIKGVNTHEEEIRYWKSFFEDLLITLQVNFDASSFVEWLADVYSNSQSFECFKDVHPVLAELRTSGFKLGLISNAFPSADRIIEDLNLRPYFDYSILSFEFEYVKPEPEIYHLAVEKLEVEIHKTVFVDDHWGFVEAAKKLGMNAYLLQRYPNQCNELAAESQIPRIYDLFKLRDEILRASKGADHSSSYSNKKSDDADTRPSMIPANSFAIP